MVNNLFEDMPEAPTSPWDLGLPRYFPDLQGENRGLTPGAGCYQNEFLLFAMDSKSKSQETCRLWNWNVPSCR